MLVLSLLIALAVIFVTLQASTEVPERARGGEYYKEQIRKYGKLRNTGSNALTWNAPVDHFNAASKDTFKQRYTI